ncbi:MAG: insulinase family protein [Candidatus Kapabacteria bacterium]|nr:insulinase family protein [Candidatus Kapabacteria bacterium]
MKNRFILSTLLLVFVFASSSSFSQELDKYTSINEMIKPDPAIKMGTLKNGIKYYIKKNSKPEKRMELRLVVNAGSVQEDDNQKGIAHFLEHMCFNGTKNFPKNELVNFLEKTGVKFGAHLNAYTSFDRTVYMLMLPTDIKKKGMQVLSDWAHNVSFDPSEIDKERGVVREEERVRKSGDSKAQLAHIPVMFYKSKLADRLPIGDTNIIKNSPYDVFTKFYKDWYRPDLMAVIAVGDFDEDGIESLIKDYFDEIPAVTNGRKKESTKVAMNTEPLVSISTNKEVTFPVISLTYKREKEVKEGTYFEMKQNLSDGFISAMISLRMQEITQRSNPPFQRAGVQIDNKELGDFASTSIFAVLKNEDLMRGYGTLLTEFFRAVKNGFLQSELDRVKKETLTNFENMVSEKDKVPSGALANEYISNFLDGESIAGIDREFALTKRYCDEITLTELNERIKKLVTKENMVFTLTAPDKEGVKIPTSEKLLEVYNQVSNKTIAAYKDEVSSKVFFTKTLTPGSIAKEEKNEKQGVTTWTLSNGAKVVFKPTKFQNDEISMNAFSAGGHSLVSDADFNSATACDDIVNACGLGEFNNIQLPKVLAGKTVRINPYVTDYYEGFSGSTNQKDFETFFQALNMYFTAPRVDKDGFDAYISNTKASIANSKVSPNSVYQDTIRATMGGYNLRRMPMTAEFFDKVDMNKAFEIYKQRFANAGDFTFVFVGNIEEAKLKEFANKYIASLPSTKDKESWKEIKINEPKGKLHKEVKKGSDPKGVITVTIPGTFEYNQANRYQIQSLVQILSIKLREKIREEKGGAYGVGVSPQMSKYPKPSYKIVVSFTCPPQRVPELLEATKDVLKETQDELASDDNMTT